MGKILSAVSCMLKVVADFRGLPSCWNLFLFLCYMTVMQGGETGHYRTLPVYPSLHVVSLGFTLYYTSNFHCKDFLQKKMSYPIHHNPLIKGMQNRPCTVSINWNYLLCCVFSAPETLQYLWIGGDAVAEEIWKTTTSEAQAEKVFIILLACLNTLTKSCLLLYLSTLPFL